MIDPFESLGHGMMRALLESQARAAAPVAAAPNKKRRVHRVPRQERLPIEPVEPDDDEQAARDAARRTTVADLESEIERRRRAKAEKQREPTAAEVEDVRRSQEYQPAERDEAERDELIDSTFLS